MIVFAGPNGAGKSMLYATRVAPSFAGPFINADIIQRDELRDPSPEAFYEAARIASSRRAECLTQARDFTPRLLHQVHRFLLLSALPVLAGGGS